MLSPNMTELLGKQVTTERQNEAAYLALMVQADNLAWEGSTKFFGKSAQDEAMHGAKIMGYMNDRGNVPPIGPVNTVKSDGQLDDMYAFALKLEEQTTDKLVAIYAAAVEEGDFQTAQFLNWYMDEQTDSVKQMQDRVTELSRTDMSDWPILDEKYGED